MINVVVYGNLKWSVYMKELLEGEYSSFLKDNGSEEVCVKSFVVDSNPDKSKSEISLDEFAKMYNAGDASAIVIPKEYYLQYNALIQKIVKLQVNVNDIYNGCRLNSKTGKPYGGINTLITSYLQDSYLSYLEYHVADHCNLNCKYCTHYSPLVKEPVFTDFEKWKKDLSRLKMYIDDIGIIRILGGEPLLNKELPEYIEYTRKLYPSAIIYIVTNGMLLDRLSEDLISTMKRNMAFFHISYYPPLENRIDAIKKNLVDKDIAFAITPMIQKFNKTQLLNAEADEDFFYDCFQATCTCVHDGKIAPCYAPFTTKYFNDAFDKKLPVDEGINLFNEENTLEDIKLNLLYPLERCKYCQEGNLYNWEVVGKNSKLEDWVDI